VFKVASAIEGGNDTFVVIGDVTLEDNGTLEVQSGTLSVEGDFVQEDGSTTVNADQLLAVTGSLIVNGGIIALHDGAEISVDDGFYLDAGTLRVIADSPNDLCHGFIGGDLYAYGGVIELSQGNNSYGILEVVPSVNEIGGNISIQGTTQVIAYIKADDHTFSDSISAQGDVFIGTEGGNSTKLTINVYGTEIEATSGCRCNSAAAPG
jgi:hypothetical protein